jgi:hypothetical protein
VHDTIIKKRIIMRVTVSWMQRVKKKVNRIKMMILMSYWTIILVNMTAIQRTYHTTNTMVLYSL